MTLALLNVASRLEIGTTPPFALDNKDGVGLRVEWEITKTRTPEPDQGTIAVFNLSRALRSSISAALARTLTVPWPWPATFPIPLNVSLYVGWSGIPELLFSGQSWRTKPGEKRGRDIITTLEVGDGVEPTRDTPPAGGVEFGVALAVTVPALLNYMGLRPSATALDAIATAAAQIPIASSLQNVGQWEPKDQLDQLMATLRLSWGIVDGEFVVFDGGLRNDVLPSILTPDSGLLSWAEQDDGAVAFEALAQARVSPGVQLQLRDGNNVQIGGGPLRTESITFAGTSEGPSIMRGTARRVQLL